MKTWKKTAAVLAGVTLLGMNTLPALAVEGDINAPTAAPEEQQVAPYAMGGWATIKELPGQQNENQMLVSIQNPGEEQPWELVLNLSEQTIFLDNETGVPVTQDTLKEGQAVYVYYSMAMTRSLPPQSAGYAVLTNVSEQSAPAKLHVVEQVLTGADGTTTVLTDHGSMLVSMVEDTKMSHLVNKSVVTAQDMKLGTWFFAWYDVVALSYPGQAAAQRVVVLPEQQEETVEIQVNGQAIEAKAQKKDGVMMVPVRAVAEALGFSVSWDQQAKQAVLASDLGQVALTVGQDSYQYSTKVEGAVGLSAPQNYGAAPEIQQPGTTWAPVEVFSLLAQQDVVSFVDGALQINVTEK